MVKVSIIGGCGHVGLPLGITLALKDCIVTLIDTNVNAVRQVNEGKMPFLENGAPDALKEARQQNRLIATTQYESIQESNFVIVTLGTPVDEHLSPVPRIFENLINEILPFMSSEQILILRSTVTLGTTDWLQRKLAPLGIRVSYCPERILQGNSIEELGKLPQIISAFDEHTFTSVSEFFKKISPKIIRLTAKEAELSKLFLNAYRYATFAISNEFFMLSTDAGVDYSNVLRGMKEDYPRGKSIPSAGFAAGPCLLKDTLQILAGAQNRFAIGSSAMLVNEGLAPYVVHKIASQHDLSKMTVAVLGMAFKADNDDIRSSLSYRIKKELFLLAGKVICSDPYVHDDTSLVSTQIALEEADLVIIGAPHSMYKELTFNVPVYDIWNMVSGSSNLFSESVKYV